MNHQLDLSSHSLQVTIPGDILSSNAAALREDLFQLLGTPGIRNGDWTLLRLELSRAKMIDSVGLNLLVALVRDMKAQNRKLQAFIASPNIHRTFQFTRLDQQIQVVQR